MPRLTLDRLADLRTSFLADDLPCTEEMCAWTEEQASAYYESGGEVLPDVRCYPRVWLTSDVHTDRENNMEWCHSLPRHPHGDVLIVAGDLSHRLEIIEETLRIFVDRFTRGARRCPSKFARVSETPALPRHRPNPRSRLFLRAYFLQCFSSPATTTCG